MLLENFRPKSQLVTRVTSVNKPRFPVIDAYVGCYGENLGWMGRMLEACPNYYIDISARLGELGRQPYTAWRFLIQYQDRILFGSDMGPNLDAYRLCYHLLETDDEYFNYNTSAVPRQGGWYA